MQHSNTHGFSEVRYIEDITRSLLNTKCKKRRQNTRLAIFNKELNERNWIDAAASTGY